MPRMSKNIVFFKGIKKKFQRKSLKMSVAHVDEDDDLQIVEKALPSGDFYTGKWKDDFPQGQGSYIWSDGCIYAGEWHKGKITGKGKFSWPSGATYEGEFKSGYMDGKGSYSGFAGDSYTGFWVMNLKHGNGNKKYSNGDCYEGEWRRGLQDGNGGYKWKNGNQYIGQWKNGGINGNGSMIWSNGNRYDGFWEDGFPKGNGTFRFSDGSFYVGVWSKDPKEMSGTYYPSNGSSGNFDWDPQEVFVMDLKDCKISPGEKILVFLSQKMPTWSDSGEDSPESGVPVEVTERGGCWPVFKSPPKKQGETISKGHKNYELMLNLQLGIRHSVGRPGPAISLDLKPSAFDPKEKVWTKFPPEGSKHTPPHQSCDFRWKDYCPLVFRTLRKLFHVDAADYMLSICGNDALRELSSPGKSGSFFYLTHDDRYMIKTMKKAEVKVLIRMLPAYYNHVKSFENTLVTKFYGLHCVKLPGSAQKKVRFVIMGNLFCTDYGIHRRFDLKGSSHGRTSSKPESEIDPSTTLKDLDLNYLFRLSRVWFPEFCRQVDRDCDFLEQERIMDYSLLIGLHFRGASGRDSTPRTSGARTPTGQKDDAGAGGAPRLCREKKDRVSRADMDQILLESCRWSSLRLGINMGARVEKTVRKSDCETQLVGEPTGELHDVILFFGIIDILQDYDISKKLEHAYKSMHYDPTSISAVDPKQYSKRFRDFIFRVFVEDR